MRLLFVIHGPVYGGGHAQFARLREPLARRGWEVVAATPARAPAAERLRDEGIEVVEVPLQRLRRTPDPRVQLPFLAGARREIGHLRQVLDRHAIDAVQAHGDTNPHVALAAHRSGRAVVWQLYDTVTPPPLRRVTMPLVTRVADVITTWGRELGLTHPGTERLGERWVTVFPPVDEREFRPPTPQRRRAARAELGIPDDAYALLAVGNRNPTKGHDHLVAALGQVRRAHPDTVARVLGAPSPPHAAYEASVRAAAAALGLDATAFDIRDGGRRVPELLAGADALVLSSVRRSEGMPTVILEAMACGLPVVATDVGAVRELVDDGVTGIVVEPEDPAALAAGIARLRADPELGARMGIAGLERYRREFSLLTLADITAGAYDLALRHRRSRG